MGNLERQKICQGVDMRRPTLVWPDRYWVCASYLRGAGGLMTRMSFTTLSELPLRSTTSGQILVAAGDYGYWIASEYTTVGMREQHGYAQFLGPNSEYIRGNGFPNPGLRKQDGGRSV